MMQLLNNKAKVRIVSIIVVLIFVIGIGALAYTQMATPGAANTDSTIGIVDSIKIQSQENPVYVAAGEQFQAYYKQKAAEAQAKINAAADDQAKAQIQQETSADLEAKQAELMKDVIDKTNTAAKAVGEAKGLTIVLTKDAVLYGGVDITDQVLSRLKSEAAAKK